MRKLNVFFFLLACITAGAIEPPAKVKQFYDNLLLLDRATDENEAYRAQRNMNQCFSEGLEITMDGSDAEMTYGVYTSRLYTNIRKTHTLKVVGYKIENVKTLEQPDHKGNEATHRSTYVTKTYIRDGQTIVYRDFVSTLISNGLIATMQTENRNGQLPLSHSMNIEQLRASAAYYYTNKHYEDAYSCYEMIVKNDPTDGDACYRLALLTFWRKGCKDRFTKKEAHQIAQEYIEKAILYASPDISVKARRVEANWRRGNVYF